MAISTTDVTVSDSWQSTYGLGGMPGLPHVEQVDVNSHSDDKVLWSGLDEFIGADSSRRGHYPGEEGRISILAHGGTVTGRLSYVSPDGSRTVVAESINIPSGTIGRFRFTIPEQTGQHRFEIDGNLLSRFVVESDDPPAGTYTSAYEREATETEEIDPANYTGIVNADNEQGIALAPSLRREGASLGPNGATVNLPDGRSVEVGAIQEADEVARVIEGDNAGEVIDADQPATDDGSSSSTESSNGFGAGATALALLVAGYAVSRR